MKSKITYKNIEAERVRNDLTKTELADKLGVTFKTYSNWQQNGGNIPASKLVMMSNLFNCSIDYLLEVRL